MVDLAYSEVALFLLRTEKIGGGGGGGGAVPLMEDKDISPLSSHHRE